MNLEEYDRRYRSLYSDFATTVQNLLEHIIQAANLPIPQSIQSRAKTTASLKARLEEADELSCEKIETIRRDLAGARLIFYTNNDVNAFLNSGILFANFDIENESVKIHYPTEENDRVRYRASHYTVHLKEERLKLPEYMRFIGLRCEIQIQTILNHAWSETTHDILYKSDPIAGFGKAAMGSLQKRINKIMDDYLLPAGYEFQRIQADYERFKKGKLLFDRDVVASLFNAKDNNERYDILTTLKEYTLPNYDDLAPIYQELMAPLMESARAAKVAPIVPLPTPFGDLAGNNAESVIRLIVEIFDYMRYLNVRATLDSLMTIYREESDTKIRDKIVEVVKRLAEYNLSVWKQVGPGVQYELVAYLSEQLGPSIDETLDIALTVWGEALKSELTGSAWRGQTVTISTGAITPSKGLTEIRSFAMDGLFAAFDRSLNNNTKLRILGILSEATRLPMMAEYSKELIELTLADAGRIVEFVTIRSDTLSYELKQDLEYRFHQEYHHSLNLADKNNEHLDCKDAALVLARKISYFRDLINEDNQFVRYKVLVGFKSIFEYQWEQENVDFQEAEEYRQQQISQYITELVQESQEEWLRFLERCAAVQSADLATFSTFTRFLSTLSQSKPDIAEYFVTHGNSDVLAFLAAFLEGLRQSADPDVYNRVVSREILSGVHLWALARHWRFSKPAAPDGIAQILNLAIKGQDAAVVGECVIFALENAGTDRVPSVETFYRPSLHYLTAREDTHWIGVARFSPSVASAFATLAPDDVRILLDNISCSPKINSAVENVLAQIARYHLEAVWDFFGRRLTDGNTDNHLERFEAVPYALHGLQDQLSADPRLAVEKGWNWYLQDSNLFQYRGGRLLSAAFSHCTEKFAQELSQLVLRGAVNEAKFTLNILRNYVGEPTVQTVLRDIVFRNPDEADVLSGVRQAFDNTGAVWGQYGFVDAMQNKKQEMMEWFSDERENVKAFAKRHFEELNLRIAAEQRRADEDAEMRRRSFEDDSDNEDVD